MVTDISTNLIISFKRRILCCCLFYDVLSLDIGRKASLIFVCTVSRSLPVCLYKFPVYLPLFLQRSDLKFSFGHYFLLLGFPWVYFPFGLCPVKGNHKFDWHIQPCHLIRDGSRAAATSKMECFVIIVNGWKPLTIITKHSILDVAAALDPLLLICHNETSLP